jgi:alpha-pyrone synthase
MTTAYLNRIATAAPPHDMHRAFAAFAETLLPEGTPRNLLRRMARMAAIDHRYTFVHPVPTEDGTWKDAEGFYVPGHFPPTARRMQAFEQFAPRLARCALDRLALTEDERRGITHVIVTSCTGLYAPGLDYEVVNHLKLDSSVERTFIGFMGCYAAINALKAARHIIRSEPDAKIVLLSLELCSLHMQETGCVGTTLPACPMPLSAPAAPPSFSSGRAVRKRKRTPASHILNMWFRKPVQVVRKAIWIEGFAGNL